MLSKGCEKSFEGKRGTDLSKGDWFEFENW